MFIALKIIHLLAVALGGASAVTSAIVPRALRRSKHEGPPPKPLAMTVRVLTIGSLVAILLLWITGIAMWRMAYAGADLGPFFIAKLVAATTIFGISIWLNILSARAARTGKPANPGRVKRLGMGARWLFVFTIITAVIVFANA